MFMVNLRSAGTEGPEKHSNAIFVCHAAVCKAAQVFLKHSLILAQRQFKKWHKGERKNIREVYAVFVYVCVCLCLCVCVRARGRTGIMSDSRHPATSDFD